VGIWFSFNGFAQILGGLIAYAIARGVDKHGSSIEGWKINFLWTGLLTIVVGIIFFFVVPDNQLNARFLSKEDQILAIERIRKNQQGGMVPLCAFSSPGVYWADLFPVGNKHFKMYQLKEVCLRFSLLQDFFELTYIQGPPRPALLDVHVLRPRCGLSNSPMQATLSTTSNPSRTSPTAASPTSSPSSLSLSATPPNNPCSTALPEA